MARTKFSLAYVIGKLKVNGHNYWGEGLLNTKKPYRDVPPTWVAKSAFWYMNDPLKMQNLVSEWVGFP